MRHQRLVRAWIAWAPFLLGSSAGSWTRSGAMPAAPAEPRIPAHTVRVTDFGAVADGPALNTAAFAAAIESVAARGGGRVVVPPGLWKTGPIVLRSRIDLHLERGALIQFSDNRDDYPLVETVYEGRSAWRCQSPISGRGLEHVAITGEGILDGAGQVWRPVKRGKMTAGQWSALVASGGVVNSRGDIWYPSAGSLEGNERTAPRPGGGPDSLRAVKDALRPVMLSLVECRFVRLEGPTFQNSPAWCLHPLLCEDLTVRNVQVRNPWYSQNGDGLDLESCRNVLVEGCSFDVGDDAICLKSGRDAEGRRRGKPTEDVRVRDCVVYHGHGGFVVGSEMSGGVRNVHVTDCTFIGTDVGLRFKSTRGRGGVVEHIVAERIRMTGIPNEAILFDLFYGGQAPGDRDETAAGGAAAIRPVTEETPAFRSITLRDIVCLGAGRAALLRGLPEMPLQNIRLENVQIEDAKAGLLVGDAANLTLDRVRVGISQGPALAVRDGRDVLVADFTSHGGDTPSVEVTGPRTAGVRFSGQGTPASAVKVSPEVRAGAAQFD